MEAQTPIDKFPALKDYFDRLKQLLHAHIEICKDMWTVGAGVYPTDFVVEGIVKRSMDLVQAIIILMENWNYPAAAPLLRLQLDNLMRIHYIAKLKDPKPYIIALLQGGRWDKLKGPDGQRLTDKRLREFANTSYPWFDKVYKVASEWVHFSGRHIYVTIINVNERNNTTRQRIGVGLPDLKEAEIAELLSATVHATEALLQVVAGWVKWKRRVAPFHKECLRELGLLKDEPERKL